MQDETQGTAEVRLGSSEDSVENAKHIKEVFGGRAAVDLMQRLCVIRRSVREGREEKRERREKNDCQSVNLNTLTPSPWLFLSSPLSLFVCACVRWCE